MNIKKFKKGDEIVRVCPAKSPGFGVDKMTGERCVLDGARGFMGDKFKFIGIANEQIYIESTDPNLPDGFDKVYNISLDLWDEGWEYWVDPYKSCGDGLHRYAESLKRRLGDSEGDNIEFI